LILQKNEIIPLSAKYKFGNCFLKEIKKGKLGAEV
jgi:uncharacterized GH25 family protein